VPAAAHSNTAAVHVAAAWRPHQRPHIPVHAWSERWQAACHCSQLHHEVCRLSSLGTHKTHETSSDNPSARGASLQGLLTVDFAQKCEGRCVTAGKAREPAGDRHPHPGPTQASTCTDCFNSWAPTQPLPAPVAMHSKMQCTQHSHPPHCHLIFTSYSLLPTPQMPSASPGQRCMYC